jgi:hypothetical protein
MHRWNFCENRVLSRTKHETCMSGSLLHTMRSVAVTARARRRAIDRRRVDRAKLTKHSRPWGSFAPCVDYRSHRDEFIAGSG